MKEFEIGTSSVEFEVSGSNDTSLSDLLFSVGLIVHVMKCSAEVLVLSAL